MPKIVSGHMVIRSYGLLEKNLSFWRKIELCDIIGQIDQQVSKGGRRTFESMLILFRAIDLPIFKITKTYIKIY